MLVFIGRSRFRAPGSPIGAGSAVTTLHDSEGWYAARVLVELYRYDRAHNQVKPPTCRR